jgi:HEAT repeat protein
LGRSTDPGALPELTRLLTIQSAEVRRLAASAIGKLASFGAEASAAVKALAPVAMRDPHPQAQQYALKALKSYGAAARQCGKRAREGLRAARRPLGGCCRA